MVIDQVMKQAGQEALITSCNDSKHAKTSSHYRGMAVDLRSKWFENPEQVLGLCIDALGNNPDFDLLYESKGKIYEHFHLQYLPKRRD
jgi:hypothetical protein